MTREEVLLEFSKGFDCASVVLGHFYKELNMEKEVLLKLGSPFSGGIGENSICGALAGALMVIGLKYGNSVENDEDSKTLMLKKRYELINKFKENHGAVSCSSVLGYDLTKKDDLKIIMDNNLLGTKCPDAVVKTIEILKEILSTDE